jgi:hypothetical protein
MDIPPIVSAGLQDPLGYLVLLYLLGVALSGAGAVLIGPLRRLRRMHMQP